MKIYQIKHGVLPTSKQWYSTREITIRVGHLFHVAKIAFTKHGYL